MILGKSETVQITIRDTKDLFFLYEIPPSRVARQVIGLRIPRSWLEHLDDESLDAIVHCRDRELGFARLPENLLFRQVRLWFVPSSDWHDRNCHGGMSTQYTRSNVLIVGNWSLHTHWMNDPCWSEDPPSRAQRRLETYILMISSFSALCTFQTYMPIRRPSKCSVPMPCTTSCSCAHWVRQYTRESFGQDAWTAFQARSGSSCSASFAHAHLDAGRCEGVNRVLLQRLLGGWAFAMAFRREVFVSLDASNTAATALLPRRRCRVNGALTDELVLVTWLAPLGTLQDAPRYGCISEWRWRLRCATQEAWLALHELAEEKGEHVRLDWNGDAPPSSMRDGRAAAAPLACSSIGPRCFHTVFSEASTSISWNWRAWSASSGWLRVKDCVWKAANGTGGFTRGQRSCLQRTLELTKD